MAPAYEICVDKRNNIGGVKKKLFCKPGDGGRLARSLDGENVCIYSTTHGFYVVNEDDRSLNRLYSNGAGEVVKVGRRKVILIGEKEISKSNPIEVNTEIHP